MADQNRNANVPWLNVVAASLMMLATLPGRTQGLGLITEPMLRDLHLDRVLYADINLWATLIGSATCVPIGWVLDRLGLRWPAVALILSLAGVVWCMSFLAATVLILFLLILATRAIGQSALSVVSISTVGKTTSERAGLAMGIYAVLLSVLFAAAFVFIGGVVRHSGWRTAWGQVALGLAAVIAPLVLFLLREPARSPAPEQKDELSGLALTPALGTRAFWVFGGGTALFGLVSSGLGLFNEAILAERGFDQKTYHEFLAVTTLIALLGQFLCGWLSLRWSMQRLLGIAMFLYAAALIGLPFLRTLTQLWVLATLMGLAAGMITVLFFAIWSHAFGRIQLGRIQGAAQMLTVFASAVGPLIFAKCNAMTGSYTPLLLALAPVVFLLGVTAWFVSLPKMAQSCQVRPAAAA